MRITMAAICALLTLSLGSSTGFAQMKSAPGPAAGTIATPAAAFDSQLSIVESEMMGAVRAMPAEKFNFAPSASIFVPSQETTFTGVRTFAQQATHVASSLYFFYSTVSGLKPDVDPSGIDKLTKKDDIVSALAGGFAFAHRAMATLTPANAFEVVKSPEPGLQTRATLASFGVSHAFDHYGQMAVYLRMNGIIPPASAPR